MLSLLADEYDGVSLEEEQEEEEEEEEVCVCFVSFTHHRKTSSICISHSFSQHNSPN